jgi:hypothetical protein
MTFKYKALLLFVILLLGLILCSFLGGNCGINHKEGFTKNTKSSNNSSKSLNSIATYYGPNGNTAQIVKNSNNTYSIVVGDCSGNDCSGNDISGNDASGNDASGSMIDCSCNYTIYTSTSASTSYELTVFKGTNGGVARVIRVDNGNTAIEITLPNGMIELFTITKTPPSNNNSKYHSWPSTPPQSQPQQQQSNNNNYNNYDNYNHYSGLSVSTVYYGPNGATAKVVETANSYNIIITYPNGQTTIYTANTNVTSNTIYVTTYTGSNGGKAVFINGPNGKALEVSMPNGNTFLFTVNNPQTYNPDYINNTPYGTANSSNSNNYDYSNSQSTSYPYSATNTASNTNTNTNTYPSGKTGSGSSYNYSSSLPPGIPASQIPPGSEDLYILKSEVVPPVCPACPTLPCNMQSEKETCPPCPACARCPQSNFECKKVPNYDTMSEEFIPVPVLNDFSQFGM